MSAGTRLPGTPEPTHWWTGTDGLRLAGDCWGDPQGPLVILQHGGGQTRHAWKGTGETLAAAGFFVVAFDARGHGDSHWDAHGRYGWDLMAQDLRCVVEALGGRRPVLVGASMGGLTSLTAIGEGLVDAAALVLVDVTPTLDKSGVANIVAFMRQKPEGFSTLEEVAHAIAAYQPHRRAPRNLDGLAKNVRLGSDGRYKWHWDPRFLDNDRSHAEREADLVSYATRLSIPTMLIRGGLSDVVSQEGAEAFLAMCTHSEYVNLPDAAHMVAGDRNDAFGDAMIEFLMRVAPARAAPHAQPA